MPNEDKQNTENILQNDSRVEKLLTFVEGNGKKIAVAVIVVGIVGALGSALRPILMHKYGNAATGSAVMRTRTAAEARRAIEADAAGSPSGAASPAPFASKTPSSQLEAYVSNFVRSEEDRDNVIIQLKRLAELHSEHRSRHPLWYGDVTPDFLKQTDEALKVALERDLSLSIPQRMFKDIDSLPEAGLKEGSGKLQ